MFTTRNCNNSLIFTFAFIANEYVSSNGSCRQCTHIMGLQHFDDCAAVTHISHYSVSLMANVISKSKNELAMPVAYKVTSHVHLHR